MAHGVSAILSLEANRECQQSFVKIYHRHEVVKLQFTAKRLWDNGQILGMLNTQQIFREALEGNLNIGRGSWVASVECPRGKKKHQPISYQIVNIPSE